MQTSSIGMLAILYKFLRRSNSNFFSKVFDSVSSVLRPGSHSFCTWCPGGCWAKWKKGRLVQHGVVTIASLKMTLELLILRNVVLVHMLNTFLFASVHTRVFWFSCKDEISWSFKRKPIRERSLWWGKLFNILFRMISFLKVICVSRSSILFKRDAICKYRLWRQRQVWRHV